jgi:3-sulfinopropanoyl-CoA desulfinase
MSALSESEARWQGLARELAAEAARQAAETDRSGAYPWPMVQRLTEAGVMGMTLPAALGGRGASVFEACLVIEELAAACAVTGRIAVEANMGAVGAIMAYGSEAQRRLAADLVLAGDKPAICITEPEAGSAATEMTTRAVRSGSTWQLSGEKTWITGGGVSKLHLVFARAVEDGREKGIGGFIVIGHPPGFVLRRRIPSMGLCGMPEAELEFHALEVPDAMVLRPPGGFVRGFGRLIDAYNAQRVGAATVALGIAAGAHRHAVERAQARRQFGRPIGEFQGLAWMIADMGIAVEAARAMIHRAARSAGPAGFPERIAAAQAKILASETAIRVTNDALQVWGAAGYSRDNPLERMVRDARMFAIAGGTAQVLRNLVAESMLGLRLPLRPEGTARFAAE